ncbi:MAG: hypothetical protein D3924_09705 [Candidatus Electrothrix sp. AR4]|nr:hypothetical protein [Candidatus Electrothrix sp. AR4]
MQYNKVKAMNTQDELAAEAPDSTTSFSITESMLLSLRQTKPWIRVMSVIGFIFIGFMAISWIFNFYSMFKSEFGRPPVPMLLLGGASMLTAFLYLLPSLYLFKFASSLNDLFEGGGARELEEALAHQKAFWKFVGILTLIVFALVLVGICLILLMY